MSSSNYGAFENTLFTQDFGNFRKFVSFNDSSELLTSSVVGGNYVTIGSSDWSSKANASTLNNWQLISVHLDVPAGAGKSSCWVNGNKVKAFQARTKSGLTRLIIGDISKNPGSSAALSGDIQAFLLYQGFSLSEEENKVHYKVLCERYEVDHDSITFT